VKPIRIKQRQEPWMTWDILSLIDQRDQAFNQNPYSKSDEHFATLTFLRNHTQITVTNA